MYSGIPISTLQTMQDIQHIDRSSLRYLIAGVIVLLVIVGAVAVSV